MKKYTTDIFSRLPAPKYIVILLLWSGFRKCELLPHASRSEGHSGWKFAEEGIDAHNLLQLLDAPVMCGSILEILYLYGDYRFRIWSKCEILTRRQQIRR